MNATRLVHAIVITATTLCMAACSQYEFNLNGHNLYRPPALFSDFVMDDPAFSLCVKQTILEEKIVRAEDLVRLRCPSMGIKTTKGLAAFQGLAVVDMGQNALTHLDDIQNLPKLRQLNAEGNPALPCPQLQNLRAKGVQVLAPQCLK